VIAHAIDKRARAVAGIEWKMVPASEDPADERAAEIMKDLLKPLKRFGQSRKILAEETIFRGSSFFFIEGDRVERKVPKDTEARLWWVPLRLQHVDRWRFQISRTDAQGTDLADDPLDIVTEWQMFSVTRQQWESLETPEWFLKSTFDDREETLGYGRGLLQSIFFYWRAKEVCLAQLLAGVERWAQGFVEVAIDDERLGSEDRDNDTIVDEYIDEINKHRSEHVFVHSKGDDVKIHDGSKAGHDMALNALDYLDRGLNQLILTSVLPTGGGGEQGSFARAETEADQMEATFQSDRMAISEDITEDLVGMVWDRNQIMINVLMQEEGLGVPGMPSFEIVQQAKENHETNATIAAMLLDRGVDLVAEEVYQRTGWTEPKEGQKVIKGREASPEGVPPLTPNFSDRNNKKAMVELANDVRNLADKHIRSRLKELYTERKKNGAAA